ncbi:hypothetical protein [Streptomyces sp. NBC_00588]|jgi:hypothetical protein|uniref:hypothetical protein n=1 Tax=Streptomyces sp. NBC_00588 TaxID=2975784 RepID=UPI002E8145F6|nr:hypothetical protein [Streptomyces sp. NBC_00588]WUB36449.1 hypothetical protein OHN38_16610 [Streptomyces sp. NBC_00588]
MRRTALAAVCLLAAATTGLVGCQSGKDTADDTADGKASATAAASKPKDPFAGLSADEIGDRAMKATTEASSLRMKGTIQDDASDGTIRIDMALDKKNECAGTLGMGAQGKADLIKTGDTVYMKYDEAFLREQSKGEAKADVDAAVDMLAGKWTKMSAKGSDAKDIASFCDLDTVLGGAEDVGSGGSSGSAEDPTATRAGTAKVDGREAAVLKVKDGKERYTLYVATEGKPYLLRLDSTAKDPGSITFGDFDEPVPAQKPAGKILDLDALGG